MAVNVKQAETYQLENWKINFFTIWGGQAFSLLASRVVQFALVWWLTQLTGSATVLATASLVAILPEIILSPLAGVYIDRWNRRVVMIVADGLVALASLWLGYLFWMGDAQVWHIYIIMAIRAVGGSFHWPAMQASTSLMVPREQLTRVSGLNQTLNGVLNIAGPPLGALLMGVMPLYGIMLSDVATASLAIFPLFFMRVPQPERKEESVKETTVLADMREGIRYILNWRGLVILIAIAMIIKIALTPAFSLLPLLVSKHFGGGAAQLSLLEAVVGAGIIVGGVLLSVWGGFKKRIYTTMLGLVVLGLSFLALGFVPGSAFVMALVIIFFVGLTIPMIDGPIMAILQSVVAPDVQGRVFTIMGSLVWITSPFSLAIAGPISDWLGLQMWYLLAGTLCGAAGLISFFISAAVDIEQNNAASKQKEPLELANIQVL